MSRTFQDFEAKRERVPVLLGLTGPSGTGKTYSALRLATGIQRVSGGDIYVIDTEARRALHYAEQCKFRHVEFRAPFGALDYLAAIEHCLGDGHKAGVVIVDSMSHEHEGPGGLLEQHDAEVERLSGGDWGKAERIKMLAWVKPKAARRRLINSLLQHTANFIFCFRAKEKLKLQPGKEPVALGWMPIAGEEFLYEMLVSFLLLPGALGVPTWRPTELGERAMVKLPAQFAERLLAHKGPIDEDLGVAIAQWAQGGQSAPNVEAVLANIAGATTPAALEAIVPIIESAGLQADKRVRAAYKAQRQQVGT